LVQCETKHIVSFEQSNPISVDVTLIWGQGPITLLLKGYTPKVGVTTPVYKMVKSLDVFEKTSKRTVPLAPEKGSAADEIHKYKQWVQGIINEPKWLKTFANSCYSGYSRDCFTRLFRLSVEYYYGHTERHDVRRM
jgi:hypothetical protein